MIDDASLLEGSCQTKSTLSRGLSMNDQSLVQLRTVPAMLRNACPSSLVLVGPPGSSASMSPKIESERLVVGRKERAARSAGQPAFS
jgi:hypothetical protein